MRKEIIGNWKMNGLLDSERTFRELIAGYASPSNAPSPSGDNSTRLTICPPATLLLHFARIASSMNSGIALGGQYCHRAISGSHTGEISAEMLRDSGARLTLVGHAERRAAGDREADVALQLRAALSAGLSAVLCVGERASERAAGGTRTKLREQLRAAIDGCLADACKTDASEISTSEASIANLASLDNALADGRLMLAYEPLWAIGSGETPGYEEIAETCSALAADARDILAERASDGARNGTRDRAWDGTSKLSISVLYGGSVKGSNAASILRHVDGLLIGKASLDAQELLAIVAASNKID